MWLHIAIPAKASELFQSIPTSTGRFYPYKHLYQDSWFGKNEWIFIEDWDHTFVEKSYVHRLTFIDRPLDGGDFQSRTSQVFLPEASAFAYGAPMFHRGLIFITKEDEQNGSSLLTYKRSSGGLESWVLSQELPLGEGVGVETAKLYGDYLYIHLLKDKTSYLDVFEVNNEQGWTKKHHFTFVDDIKFRFVAFEDAVAIARVSDRTQDVTIYKRQTDGKWREFKQFTMPNEPLRSLDKQHLIVGSSRIDIYDFEGQRRQQLPYTFCTFLPFQRDGDRFISADESTQLAVYQQQADGLWAKIHVLDEKCGANRNGQYFILDDEILALQYVSDFQRGLTRLKFNGERVFDENFDIRILAHFLTTTFATSMSMDKQWLAISDTKARDSHGNRNGIVNLYKKDKRGHWRWMQVIDGPDPEPYYSHLFGTVVELKGNRLLVRASDGFVDGDVYLFELSDKWELTQYFNLPEKNRRFGEGLATWGDWIAIGHDWSDGMWLYQKEDGKWPEQGQSFNIEQTPTLECFGCTIWMDDGHMIVREVHYYAGNRTAPSSVQLFKLNDSNQWSFVSRLTAEKYRFGEHMYFDGKTFITTFERSIQGQRPPGERNLAFYEYKPGEEEDWELKQTITFLARESASLDFVAEDGLLVVAAPEAKVDNIESAGQLYIYEKTDDPEQPWHRVRTLTGINIEKDAKFSEQIELSDNTLAVKNTRRYGFDIRVDIYEARVLKGKGQKYRLEEDKSLDINLDIQSSSDQPITCQVSAEPEHGELTIKSDTALIYDVEEGFNGLDSFYYTCQQGNHRTGPWRIDVEVDIEQPKPPETSTKPSDQSCQCSQTRSSDSLGLWIGLLVFIGFVRRRFID